MRYLLALALLTACSHGEFIGVEGDGTTAADTTRVAAGARIGKLKAHTVIIQAGAGNVATPTDNTKAGQKGGAAATAPQAQASATTKQNGSPWWHLVLGALIGSLLGACARDWLAGKLPAGVVRWLKW